jgi:hypothetical protein
LGGDLAVTRRYEPPPRPTRPYETALRQLDADIASALLAIEEAAGCAPVTDVNVLSDVGKRLRLAARGVEKLWRRHGITEPTDRESA